MFPNLSFFEEFVIDTMAGLRTFCVDCNGDVLYYLKFKQSFTT